MGVLGAAIYMFPYGKVDFFYWIGLFWKGVFTWPMWGVGLWYLGFDLLMAMLTPTGSGVANLAHLGGAVGGFLIAAVYRTRRDSADASEAKATFHETKDLSLLSRLELSAMATANPDDPLLSLHWMNRSLNELSPPKADAIASFQRLLPMMIGHYPPQSIARCVHGLEGKLSFPTNQLLELAKGLEQVNDLPSALKTYEMILVDTKASPADLEAALFRGGLACERMGRIHQAMAAYKEVVRRNPMGPFGDAARLRIEGLKQPRPVKVP
jgi:tetratricopeptide (TPR) repeat protein